MKFLSTLFFTGVPTSHFLNNSLSSFLWATGTNHLFPSKILIAYTLCVNIKCLFYAFYWNCTILDSRDASNPIYFQVGPGLASGWKYLYNAFLVPGIAQWPTTPQQFFDNGSNYFMSPLALNQNPHKVCLLSSCKCRHESSHLAFPLYFFCGICTAVVSSSIPFHGYILGQYELPSNCFLSESDWSEKSWYMHQLTFI
jgi:hypothetical protein